MICSSIGGNKKRRGDTPLSAQFLMLLILFGLSATKRLSLTPTQRGLDGCSN